MRFALDNLGLALAFLYYHTVFRALRKSKTDQGQQSRPPEDSESSDNESELGNRGVFPLCLCAIR